MKLSIVTLWFIVLVAFPMAATWLAFDLRGGIERWSDPQWGRLLGVGL